MWCDAKRSCFISILLKVFVIFFLGSKNTDAVFCACLKASLSQSECKIEENANIVICFMNYINVHFFKRLSQDREACNKVHNKVRLYFMS